MAEPFDLDRYIRVIDFSKPVSSSQNVIDIRIDNITTAIHLPDNIPRISGGALFISDGVMHMLPGWNTMQYKTNLTNRMWNFDLETQKWDIQTSGIQDPVGDTSATVAFDTRKQVGWYYGWFEDHSSSSGSERYLYRLDRGKESHTKIDPSMGSVMEGELVYLENVGDAGALVLIGGQAEISMVNKVVLFPLSS